MRGRATHEKRFDDSNNMRGRAAHERQYFNTSILQYFNALMCIAFQIGEVFD